MDMNVMFQQVSNPSEAKVGDIIYWPAEKGKVLHLHGSASTMRGLGFSVGNRYHGTQYDEIQQLFQREPTKDRLFIVSSIVNRGRRRTETEATRQTLFSNSITEVTAQTENPVTHIEVMELPLEIPNDTEDSMALYQLMNYDPEISSWFGLEIGANTAFDFTKLLSTENAQKELVKVHEFLNENTKHRYMNKALHDNWVTSTISSPTNAFQEFAEAVAATKNEDGEVINTGRIPSCYRATMPTRVIKTAEKYGAKLLRPTDEFKRMYVRKLSEYLMKRACAQKSYLLVHARIFIKNLQDDITDTARSIKLMNQSIKKNSSKTGKDFASFLSLVKGGMK